MNILALELSTGRGSIACLPDGEPVFTTEFANDRKHSGAFFAQLEHCLSLVGTPSRIVVGLGPGSYAGTRIAISTAIGLSAASGAELVGVSSLRALLTDSSEYLAIGDARRQTFYFARVRDFRFVEQPLLCSEAELRQRIDAALLPVFTSEALALFPDAQPAYPSALLLARIADTGAGVDLSEAPLQPIYLREPHITVPKLATSFQTTTK